MSNSEKFLPPRDVASEQALIGSILILEDVLDDCMRIVKPAMFFDQDLGRAFGVMLQMRQESNGIDVVTLPARCCHEFPEKAAQDWEAILSGAVDSVPHAYHAQSYARSIAEAWRKRELIYLGTKVAEDAYNPGSESGELIGHATRVLQEVIDSSASGSKTVSEEFGELVESLKEERKPGVPTGFHDLDDKTFGLAGSSLIICAARSGTGKTAFVCNLTLNTAAMGCAVLFISLEQSRRELIGRFAAMHARVDSDKLRRHALSKQEIWEVEKSAKTVSQMPIEIIDTPGQTLEEICSSARLAKARGRLDLLIIDYLQFIRSQDVRMSREQQVAGISRGLKELAKQLDVPVVALAQMSRDIEKREDKRPRMSDLRESGSIEQDADMIWFLHRPGQWDKETDQSEASIIISKNRHGSVGEIPLRWDSEYMLFQSKAKPSQVASEDYFERTGFQSFDPFAGEPTLGDF